MNNFKENIMNKIHAGQVKQKPTWYFIMSTLGVGLLGLILFFISIFWSSFLLLTLHEYSTFTQIGIGFVVLLQNILFWVFIICGISAGVLCYRWLREHTSLYRYRYMYTGIIVMAIVLGIGVSMNMIDREAKLLHKSGNFIPGLSRFDKSMRPPRPEIITEGKIISIHDTTLILKEIQHGNILYVRIPDELLVMKNINPFDRVIVVGVREGDVIYAQDVIVK
jgi:hypothetical protein